jgi:hypothetical protein
VKKKWIKDIKENPTYMKMLFECNDEASLAGDLSYGPKLSAYMNMDKTKAMKLKTQLSSTQMSSSDLGRPPLPGGRAQTAGSSFGGGQRKKAFSKNANNDAFQLR